MSLTEQEINEIRNYLKKAENPLVFFDDDHDGLASFLLFKKTYEKCQGIVVKGGMKEEEIYFRKIKEYNPDSIFILDRAEISQELIDSVNVPLIWLDHHPVMDRKGVKYYNPRIHDSEDNRPTSYWCYKIVEQNLWIAMVGIIGDYHVPTDLLNKFEYLELFNNKTNIEDILYTTHYGTLVKLFNFILKGTTTEVKNNINLLLKIETPQELLNQETQKAKYLFKFYQKINKEYESLLKRAEKSIADGKILLFVYPTRRLSLSSGLSCELKYKFPDKIVIVAREKESYMTVSLRSNEFMLPPILKKALEGLDGYGGGHDHAVGACVNKNDFKQFMENIKKEVSPETIKNVK